ncbi:MAG: hypothetical protein CR972_01520 [Candidatus Moraniibacteriota bacterium]|nr:MAG: hypothetical protein CR972_01520 [Candidatus Moranbacteria bacterium]
MKEEKKKIVIALKKARSNIDRILEKMESTEKEQECFDVIQQNLAVIGLLKSVNIIMLKTHLNHHIDDMSESSRAKKRKMCKLRDEVINVVKIAQDK